MTYAHITAGAIDPGSIGSLPRLWWDGSRWWDWRDNTTTAAGRGWLPVTDTPRPADTATTTTDYSVTLVGGVPTVTWTPRPWTPAELDARARQAVAGQLVTNTTADLAKLNQAITDLALLLGDNTTTGSLRQWRSSVTNQYSAATLRALADLVITEARATRRVARQTLRLARQMAGDYSSADVGTDS